MQEDFTCISNYELRSCCNIVNAENRILGLTDSWWRKTSKNNDYIINSTYHHQTNTIARKLLNVIKVNRFF